MWLQYINHDPQFKKIKSKSQALLMNVGLGRNWVLIQLEGVGGQWGNSWAMVQVSLNWLAICIRMLTRLVS